MTTVNLQTRLRDSVEQIEADAARFKSMVQGDTDTVVTTENGNVSSVAKRISEIADPTTAQNITLRNETQGFRNEAETFKNDSETANTAAQTAKTSAESSKSSAELAKTGSETARDQAESFKNQAEVLNPTTTAGDMIVRGSTANIRLAVGTNNQVLTVDSGSPAWKTPSSTASSSSPTTTAGDLIVRGSTADGRLAVGTNNQVLTVDSGSPAWKTPATTTTTASTGLQKGELVFLVTSYSNLYYGVDGDGNILTTTTTSDRSRPSLFAAEVDNPKRFEGVIVNNGDHFNKDNATFTAPKAGYYEFSVVVSSDTLISYGTLDLNDFDNINSIASSITDATLLYINRFYRKYVNSTSVSDLKAGALSLNDHSFIMKLEEDDVFYLHIASSRITNTTGDAGTVTGATVPDTYPNHSLQCNFISD